MAAPELRLVPPVPEEDAGLVIDIRPEDVPAAHVEAACALLARVLVRRALRRLGAEQERPEMDREAA
jgi:hypothetical protein